MVWRTRQLQDDRLTPMAHALPIPGAGTSATRKAKAAPRLRTPHPLAKGARSRGIGRDKAADLDITAKTDIPNDGFAKRVSGVSNDRLFRHLPPQTIDWNPISSRSHVVLRAMPIGNVAAGNASRSAHAFDPCANVVGYIFKLSAINRVSRSGEEGQ